MRILLCGTTFPKALERLSALLPNDDVVMSPREEVREQARSADVLIPMMYPLDAELLADTAARLIQQWGVGLEGVNIPAATANGILVCNVPADVTPNADSTAEHAVFLMMGLARRIHECFATFREGRWGAPQGEALLGNKALIVGLGAVGKALARRLIALGMTVEAVRRRPDPEDDKRLGIARAGVLSDLAAMAPQADFVISTIVLSETTRGLFGRDLLRAMKPSAFVVNVSRGPVVDEDALLDALRTGRIAGAGLDVYVEEPLRPNHPFLSMPNIFATPHVAGVTRQNYEGVSRVVAENIETLRQGRAPLYCVNERAVTPRKPIPE